MRFLTEIGSKFMRRLLKGNISNNPFSTPIQKTAEAAFISRPVRIYVSVSNKIGYHEMTPQMQ